MERYDRSIMFVVAVPHGYGHTRMMRIAGHGYTAQQAADMAVSKGISVSSSTVMRCSENLENGIKNGCQFCVVGADGIAEIPQLDARPTR